MCIKSGQCVGVEANQMWIKRIEYENERKIKIIFRLGWMAYV